MPMPGMAPMPPCDPMPAAPPGPPIEAGLSAMALGPTGLAGIDKALSHAATARGVTRTVSVSGIFRYGVRYMVEGLPTGAAERGCNACTRHTAGGHPLMIEIS